MRLKNASLMCAVIFGIWGQSFAMNGFSIAASQAPDDHLGNWNSGGAGVGHIVKYTIENNVVQRCDTIYKQYWAKYCILNVQGSKIAFLREDINGGTGTWQSIARKQYIAVMNADGTGAHDLDTLTSGDPNIRARILIAWPAGDYIYYHYNTRNWYEPTGNPVSQIWRVKQNDPSTQTLIYTYRDVHTFSMSLDATRAGITSMQGCAGKSSPFCNHPHAFPPTSDPDAASWAQGLVLGCGSNISPSGKHHWHFWEGGHTDNRIETITFPSQVNSTVSTNFNTIAGWITAATGLPADSITGGNMEWGRWAANSDKWLCGVGHNKIGATNQILWNWIDHQAINTSRNSKAINGFVPSSECGALWVAGGPCGSYEDVNGNWVATSVTDGCNGTAISQPINRGSIPASSQAVNVYTVQGKFLGAWSRATVPHMVSTGTYVLAATSESKNGIAKISITGNEVRR